MSTTKTGSAIVIPALGAAIGIFGLLLSLSSYIHASNRLTAIQALGFDQDQTIKLVKSRWNHVEDSDVLLSIIQHSIQHGSTVHAAWLESEKSWKDFMYDLCLLWGGVTVSFFAVIACIKQAAR